VVIDHGKAIVQGTADELKAQVGGERIEIVPAAAGDVEAARSVLAELAEGAVEVDAHTRRITAPVSGGAARLTDALRRLDAAGVELHDVALRRPTLDDVFLTLTGHVAEEATPETEAAA
jgi:ABC-2 type transport system ATP-binding protein